MCGIVGYLDKTGNAAAPLGKTILDMLKALDSRGPDSAGVALYGGDQNGQMTLRISLGEKDVSGDKARSVAEGVRLLGAVSETSTTAEYLRLVMEFQGDPLQLERAIESVDEGIEVVSMGRRLQIVKQVGSPENLDAAYGISGLVGTHGIGHTRLSTESRIDLSHSQPFWAHGHPDLAVVHNGHITNYHKLRRQYEQRDVKFYTENDSEVIGIYLAEQLAKGSTLEEAMEASLADLDGSYSYLAATSDALGFVRDRFALKPLLFAETDTFVAVATEEIAMRSAFEGGYEVREAETKEVRLWQT